MEDNYENLSLYEFAWHTLTDQQQYRIVVKYEIVKGLRDIEEKEYKRSVYRAVADKYGYTMDRIEDMANGELKKYK